MNIFISGGSRGIGASCATLASKLGAKVVITYNSNKDKADKIIASLNSEGNLAIKMNLGDENSISDATSQAIDHFEGKVDGVVNNAGLVSDQLIMRMKSEEFAKVLDVNLKGTFWSQSHF